MKKMLIRNYCMMMIAWSLFLNEHEVLAFLIGSAGCVLLMFSRFRMNEWRVAAICIASYGLVLSCLYAGSIPYFFPGLRVFMTVICLNAGLVNEYLYLFKVRYILPFLYAVSAAFAVLSVLIALLPDASYSLFGKGNLHLMSFFIFLPFLLPLLYCVCYKCCRLFRRNALAERKRAVD